MCIHKCFQVKAKIYSIKSVLPGLSCLAWKLEVKTCNPPSQKLRQEKCTYKKCPKYSFSIWNLKTWYFAGRIGTLVLIFWQWRLTVIISILWGTAKYSSKIDLLITNNEYSIRDKIYLPYLTKWKIKYQ
jgi:hypothetical protein